MEIQEKVSRFSQFLGITEDAFNVKIISNHEDFSNEAMLVFKESPSIFRKFLYKIFDLRIRKFLKNKFSIMGFNDDDLIRDIFPGGQILRTLNFLETESGLIFPKPVLSNLSFYVQIALLVVPGLALGVLLFLKIEFFIVLYGLVKIGAIVLVITIPYLIAYLIFPDFFRSTRFPNIVTYRDLISDLIWSNQYAFVEDDYKLTKQELEKLFEVL